MRVLPANYVCNIRESVTVKNTLHVIIAILISIDFFLYKDHTNFYLNVLQLFLSEQLF